MSGPKAKDYAGKTFGRLTVLHRGEKKGYHQKWVCKCSCGIIKEIYQTSLIAKNGTKSCGCLQKESATKHGQSHNVGKGNLYRVWINLRTRCNNPQHQYYAEYGGRGITVCEEWDDFLTFQQWALGSDYTEGLTIDRRNNDLGYNPDNCHWTNRTQQQRNRRSQKNSTSKYTGVSWCNTKKKWAVGICINKQKLNLGIFHNEIFAAGVRDAYIKEHNLKGFILNFKD